MKGGRIFPTGEAVTDVFGKSVAVLTQVSKRHYRTYLGWSRWFYRGNNFPCLQLIWSDRTGVFPWQLGASQEFANSQPDLSPKGWVTLAGQ